MVSMASRCAMIKSLWKYRHVNKPDYLYYQNGNYNWKFKRFGPFYILVELVYED